MRVLIASLVHLATAQDLVAPGGLARSGGRRDMRAGAGSFRTPSGPAVGFFVDGSSIEDLNGVYARLERAPACLRDADLVYSDMRRGLRSNYTYYDDDGEAEEELIMVLCLIVFGTILAIGLTYIAMLTYRNYYYPPLPPKQHLDPQVVEFELVEKGEEVKETDDPY